MIIKNNVFEVLTRTDVLAKLLNCEDLPVKVSYQLAKISKVMDESLQVYIKEKNKILDRYCKKEEDGRFAIQNGSLVVYPGKEDEFNADMKELFDIENEFPMERVKINIEDIPKGIVSPASFTFLENFIEFIVE